MVDNTRRVLDMLAEGKVTADEAERLLAYVEEPPPGGDDPGDAVPTKGRPKYLRVVVAPNNGADDEESAEDRVNVRVPLGLIRAGMKLTALIPAMAGDRVNQELRNQGIDFDVRHLKSDELEDLVDALAGLEVDVQDGSERVRIYVE